MIDFRNFGNFANKIHKKEYKQAVEVFCLKGPETISKINEVQLGLIATASLGSSVEVKQVKKVDLFFSTSERNGTISYHFCSQGTERYDI